MNKEFNYCGFVSIIGKPNVGKSTLLNKLLGHKVSITSAKPQTTRHRIMGIHTEGSYQTIYVDTPGIHNREKQFIKKLMNHTINSSIYNVEMIIFIVESTHWTLDDEMVIKKLRDVYCPIVLAINKIDNISYKDKILPYIHFLRKKMNFYDILPICAKDGTNLNKLVSIVHKNLPKAAHKFPTNYITDRSQTFMASEIIREKLMRFLEDELPYSVAVEIERFIITQRNSYNIHGQIIVKHNRQKKIIIGNKGNKIKIISMNSRKDMQTLFNIHVYLKLWVKVNAGYINKNQTLHYLDLDRQFL